jgi:hypothetical protein
MAVLGDQGDTLLTGLSDFWQRLFADREILKGLYAASEVQLGQAYLDLVTEVLNVNLRTTPLFNREFWKLMTMREDHLQFDSDIGKWAFDLPDQIALLQFLTNRIYNPTVMLERDVDFELDEDNRRLLFDTNVFDTGLMGVPSRLVDIVPTVFRTGTGGVFTFATPDTFVVTGLIRSAKDGVTLEAVPPRRFYSEIGDFSAADVGRILEFTDGFVRSGVDGATFLGFPDTFSSATAAFTAADIGRILVFDDGGTDVVRTIVTVPSPVTVTVDEDMTEGLVGSSWQIQEAVGGTVETRTIVAALTTEILLLDSDITTRLVRTSWQIKDPTVFVVEDIGDDLAIQDPFTPGVEYVVEITGVTTVGPLAGLEVTVSPDIAISADSAAILWQHQSKPRVLQYAFWVPDAFIDRENLYLSFGYLLDRYEPSSESYRFLLEGIFRYFILGPTLGRTEAALNVMVGIPVIREDGEVITEIDTTDPDFDLIVTDRRSYQIPKGSLADGLEVGSELEAFQVITNIFQVADHISDPNWYLGEVIPPELVPSEDSPRRNVDPQLYSSLIGNEGWVIGDPGFYIGADEDRYVPVDKQGRDGHTDGVNADRMVPHFDKFFPSDVGKILTIEGTDYTILSVGGDPEPYVQIDDGIALQAAFASLAAFGSIPEPAPALGSDRIQVTGAAFVQADVGRYMLIDTGALAGNEYYVYAVLGAELVSVREAGTDAVPVFNAGDVLTLTLGAVWDLPERPPLRHTTGYLFMRDFLKQHIFAVEYDLSEWPDIPFPRLDDDIRDVLLEGKPAYVTMFFNPNNFLRDEVGVSDELELQAVASFLDEMVEVGGTLVIGDTWDIGDYYYYGAPTLAWFDIIRKTELGSITPLPQSGTMEKVAFSGVFDGGAAPDMTVTVYAWNGVAYVPTGEIFVLDPAGVNLYMLDVFGRDLAISAVVTGAPVTFSLDYGYLTSEPATIIATEAAGYPLLTGATPGGSDEFTAAGFEFSSSDKVREIAAFVAGQHERYWISAVNSETSVDLIDVATGLPATFGAESPIMWRLGPPRRTATPVVIGGQEPAVPHPDEVAGLGLAYMLGWPIAVTLDIP